MSESSSDDENIVNELLGLSSPIRKKESPATKRPEPTYTRAEGDDDLDFDVELPQPFGAKPLLSMEKEALELIKREEELDKLLADDLRADEHMAELLNQKDETIAKQMSEELLENPLNQRYVAYVKANIEQLQDFYFIDKPADIEDRPSWASDKAMFKRSKPLNVSAMEFLRVVVREQNQAKLQKLYTCVPKVDISAEDAKEFVRLLGGSKEIMQGTRSRRLEPKTLLPPMVVTAYKLSILVQMTGPKAADEVTKLVLLFMLDARSVQPYLSDRMSNGTSTVEILNQCLEKLQPLNLRKDVPFEDPVLTHRLLSAIWLSKDERIRHQAHWLCLEAIITLDRYDEYEIDIKSKARQLVSGETDEELIHSLIKFLELWSNSVLAKADSEALICTSVRIKLLEKLIYYYFPCMPQYTRIASELLVPRETTEDSEIYGSSKPEDHELIYIHLRKLLMWLSNEYFVHYGGTASAHPVHGDCLLRLSALQHKLDRAINKSFL